MQQKRYSNYQEDQEFAEFKYHEVIQKSSYQKQSMNNNRILEFNNKEQNLQVNQIYATNNFENAKSLKDMKRQNQLYQISLKFKKILKEDFIQNQKTVEFKDSQGQQCNCLIGNEVEYPQFKSNEVYYLFGVQIKESRNKKDNFEIMIQKGKITEYPPDNQGQQTKQFQLELQNNNLEINSSFQDQSIINQIQIPSQNHEIKTYFNILVAVIKQFETKQVWSQKCGKHCYFVKVDAMDQEGHLASITLWNKFLDLKFSTYQIVFFQNLELKSYQGNQYLQTIDNVSKIIIDDSQLQLLSNYQEVKAVVNKHQENEKYKKLITYQEILKQNPY